VISGVRLSGEVGCADTQLLKPEIAKSQRAKVVSRADVTGMDVDTGDVCPVPVGPEGKNRCSGARGHHLG
jgi:hypothetical protein